VRAVAWRALVTEPGERARALVVVRDIAEALAHAPPLTSNVGAHCDRAVLRAYLAADETLPDDDHAITDHVATALAAARDSPALGLHGGLAGLAWTIAHLANDEHAQEILTTIDAALSRALVHHDWRGQYDLVSGLVGIGIYALERGDAGRPLVCRILELLYGTAETRGAGLAWHTPAVHLPDWQREQAPDGYFNLGMAHGIPGIVAWCARCIAFGVEVVRAKELMVGAASYLLDAEPPTADGRFSAWITPDGVPSGDRARPAWCYGDLGVAAALLAAAQVDPRWRDDAVALARACARRPKHASVRDTAICHGTAGIAHTFNRMYQATGDDELGKAARWWLAMTFEMRTDHPHAGFPAFDGVTRGHRADAGLLAGATGVALALHGMASEVEPLWDRTLLLDLEPTPALPAQQAAAARGI
jgi:lantibiotic biosynthesis protein